MKVFLIIIISIISISTIIVYADTNCNNLPAFHIIHINKIVDCFTIINNNHESRLNEQDIRITNNNMLFFEELQRLESKIDNVTRTIPK